MIGITGAKGFIGSHLSGQLNDVYEYTRDPGNSLYLLSQCEGVVHCAAHYTREHDTNDIDKFIDSNIRLGLKILQLIEGKWFVNLGTTWQDYREGVALNLYAASKNAFQSFLDFYVDTGFISAVTVKFTDTFGRGDKRMKLFGLLKNCLDTGERLELTKGEQIIDAIWVGDVVKNIKIAIDMAKSGLNGEVTLTSDYKPTLKELVGFIEGVSGKKMNVGFVKDYPKRCVMNPNFKNALVVSGGRDRVVEYFK